VIFSCGAAGVVRRIISAESQQASEGRASIMAATMKLGGENGRVSFRRRDAAADRADEDRQEGSGLDERIAAGELVRPQLIRQDCRISPARTAPPECRTGRAPRASTGTECKITPAAATAVAPHLGELDGLGDLGLVETVASSPPSAEQDKGGQDEQEPPPGSRTPAFGPPNSNKGQENQGVLEEIIAQGGEELAPEHRCEAPGRDEGRVMGTTFGGADDA